MKDVVIEEKSKEKEELLEGIADTTAPAKMAQASSSIDLAGKYIWAMNNANMDAAKELRLTSIMKYWRRARQVEMKFDWLHDWCLVLVTFVKHSRSIYNNEEVTQNMNARQDIDPE